MSDRDHALALPRNLAFLGFGTSIIGFGQGSVAYGCGAVAFGVACTGIWYYLNKKY